MKTAIPWIIAAVAFVAFGASFSELQRMRLRFGEVTRHQFHDHAEVRQFIIKAALVGLDRPIIIIGDSITEMARFPEAACGHPLVNAGIGGATIADFEHLAPRLLQDSKPTMIVVALGANSALSGSVRADYSALLAQLKTLSPQLLAIAVTPTRGADLANAEIRAAAQDAGVEFIEPEVPARFVFDGVHLTAAGYAKWIPAVMSGLPENCAASTMKILHGAALQH